MMAKTETASLAGLTGSVVKKVAKASSYQIAPALSTTISAPEYAAHVVSRRFRISISTARVVAHLSGLGGAQ